MRNRRTLGIIAAGLTSAAVFGGFALQTAKAAGGGKTDPPPVGKIAPWEAIKIATGKVPGRVLNGKIGDVEAVTPAGEAKEVQAELTKALGGKSASADKESDEKDEKEDKKP